MNNDRDDDTLANRRIHGAFHYRRMRDILIFGGLAITAIASGVTSITIATTEQVYDCSIKRTEPGRQ